MTISFKAAFGFLGLLWLAACGAEKTESALPGATWSAYESPVAAGFDPEKYAALEAAVADGTTHSMVVVKDGKIAFSYGDVTQTEGTYLASVRKSILTMLMGKYVESGEIDIRKTLAELGVDDVQGLTETEKSATLRDLITARSGIYHPASNFSGVTAEGPQRGDHAPGTYYWYNNWDFNAAGGIFEELVGKDIYEAFEEQFAGPLQMQDYDLQLHQENGKTGNLEHSKFAAYHFYLSARDVARLGLLMLRNGEWNGEKIITENWVRESVSIATPNAEMNPENYRDSGFAYGYMWWIFDPEHFPPEFYGGYAARGHFGQYIVVLPAVDLVFAHKTAPTPYDTPEEYAAVNVTWDEMRVLIDLTLDAMTD
ncbi:serine hydrolase [Hyphococcus flavus]|uniref:Serine hydrolase n=1 Tax=Hyphococcus flavus TaxID=1866326 RepID=A0AAF0CBP5_9PROT|nr:serine hydrolase [Hyphococcus flavus]WDI31510.1 serine hydrolase [Hyphococcus flavus]